MVSSSISAINMASASLKGKSIGFCDVQVSLQGQIYEHLCLSVLPDLCADLNLGEDFQQLHESVTFKYGGSRPSRVLCGMSTLSVGPPLLFGNITADCHPITAKSRRYSPADHKFIEMETQRLLKE